MPFIKREMKLDESVPSVVWMIDTEFYCMDEQGNFTGDGKIVKAEHFRPEDLDRWATEAHRLTGTRCPTS